MTTRNIGPIQRPPQARTERPGFFIDYSQFATMVHYELRWALDLARRKTEAWELLCFHADETGRYLVRMRGNYDPRRPFQVRLDINETVYTCATRHAAYLSLTEQLPHCMQPDWHWVFLPDSVVERSFVEAQV